MSLLELSQCNCILMAMYYARFMAHVAALTWGRVFTAAPAMRKNHVASE